MQSKSDEEIVDQQFIPAGLTITEATVLSEDGKTVDRDATVELLNGMLQAGWRFITADNGIAYWYTDEESLAQSGQMDVILCGTCRHLRGTLCDKFRFGVMPNSLPCSDDCHEPWGDDDDHG